MTTVIGSALVLSRIDTLSSNAGAIGYINLATIENLSVTSETLEGPGSNLTNPATAYRWEASSNATQTITIQTNGNEIDYIGIARHNLNQLGLTVTVRFDGVVVSGPSGVSSNQAIMFLFDAAAPDTVTFTIDGATQAPSIAVLYIGKTIRLERNIYVGHTPITYGRDRTTVNGISENGQYLGEIVVRETNSTSINLNNLTPEWYRDVLDPFFALSPRIPCFWAWRPSDYQSEIGYCWIEGKPGMSNERSNGMVSANWNFKGIV